MLLGRSKIEIEWDASVSGLSWLLNLLGEKVITIQIYTEVLSAVSKEVG